MIYCNLEENRSSVCGSTKQILTEFASIANHILSETKDKYFDVVAESMRVLLDVAIEDNKNPDGEPPKTRNRIIDAALNFNNGEGEDE